MSAFTAVLGAVPLRALRVVAGNSLFWVFGVGIVIALSAIGWSGLAIVFALHILLVGIFSEFDEREYTLRQSSAYSVFLTMLLSLSGFYIWTAVIGKNWSLVLTNAVTSVIEKVNSVRPGVLNGVLPEDIVLQLPSVLLIFLIISLGLALAFEKPVSRWVGFNIGRKENIDDFSAPDFLIWFFILSLLGTFSKSGIKSLEGVSINVLNTCAVIYFFQGSAVLGKYFSVFKIASLWRIIWVAVLVIQLPIMLSCLLYT
ncbi:MAG: DUF2232 domain-containing protein, partial [Bdellovibrionales bacterium]